MKMVRKKRNSQEVYEKFFSETTGKGQRSLINLKKMCDSLEERGLEINISLLGRESLRLGMVPSESAIRNNVKLREYVMMRIEEQKLVVKEVSGDKDLLEVIKQLRKENIALRNFIRNM